MLLLLLSFLLYSLGEADTKLTVGQKDPCCWYSSAWYFVCVGEPDTKDKAMLSQRSSGLLSPLLSCCGVASCQTGEANGTKRAQNYATGQATRTKHRSSQDTPGNIPRGSGEHHSGPKQGEDSGREGQFEVYRQNYSGTQDGARAQLLITIESPKDEHLLSALEVPAFQRYLLTRTTDTSEESVNGMYDC